VLAPEAAGIYLARFDLEAIRHRQGKTIHGNAYRRPHRYAPLLRTERDPVWERIDGIGQPYDPSAR